MADERGSLWSERALAEWVAVRDWFRARGPAPDDASAGGRNYQLVELTGTELDETSGHYPGVLVWWNADGRQEGSECWVELPEGTGPVADTPALAVQSGFADDQLAVFFCPGFGARGDYAARLTERAVGIDGRPYYGCRELAPTENGGWEDVGDADQGTVGAWIEIKKVQATNGDDVPEEWTITIHGATSGTFKLTIDGNETTALDWDADAAAILAALVAAGASMTTPFVFDDFTAHAISWTQSSLLPLPDTEGYEIFDRFAYVGLRVWMRAGKVTPPEVTITPADVDGYKTFSVSVKASGGTYTATWTFNAYPPATTAPLDWDADAATIQAAIDAEVTGTGATVSDWAMDGDMVTYTITADDAGGTADFTIDSTELVGKRDTRFDSGGGADPCGRTLDYPPLLPGYVPGADQFLVKDAAGCWKLVDSTQCEGA